MPYITTQNLIDRFGNDELLQLADPDETGSVVASIVDTAISDASVLIDGYVSKAGYDLPLTTVPRGVIRACADITRYYLWDDNASERVLELYKDAMSWLKDVAAGKTVLGEVTPPAGTPVASTGHVATKAGESKIDWGSY